MKTTWDATQEQELIESYYRTVKASYAKMVRRQLRHVCRVFRGAFGEQCILQQTGTTRWVRRWQTNNPLTPCTQAQELASLCRWWYWLLSRGMVNGNVLNFVCIHRLVCGNEPILTLPAGLHQAIAAYEKQLRMSKAATKTHRLVLRYFTRFVSRQGPAQALDLAEAFEERRVRGWVRSQAKQSGAKSAVRYVIALARFTRHLYRKRLLDEDPIANLLQRYPMRGYPGIVRALAARDPNAALSCLIRPPRFQSAIADRLEGFLNWKRMMGCKYTSAEHGLADFDRFLMCEGDVSPILTQDQLNRYAASCERVSPLTRQWRLGLVRRFCLYLKRFEKDSVVPDRYWARVRVPQFIPFIFSPEDFRRLIAGTQSLPINDSHPLRVKTLCTYLRLLYASGLRPGEALRLQNDDVDLAQGILTVRETKFFKSRLVPITRTLAEVLRDYERSRDKVLGLADSADSFLRFDPSATCSLDAMETYFRQALNIAHIASPPGKRAPRLHDLRHSFAVRRLLEWYRRGEDAQNRLPLLSTYLGHASIADTQVYLTATAELLEQANLRFDSYAGNLVKSDGGQSHE